MAWDREKERKAGKAMTIGTSVYGLVFSIAWCCIAAAMGAYFMLVFGIPFAVFMGYRLFVLLQYTKEDKKPPRKEVDPWDRPAGEISSQTTANGFCPYCGRAVEAAFEYCPTCGRKQR